MNHDFRSRLTRVASHVRSFDDLWLAVRIAMWASTLPILKRLLPFRALVRLVCRRPGTMRVVSREQQVLTFARWACRLTRPTSGGNCLERGLIAYRFLLEAGAAPVLFIGVAPGEHDELDGHAWVRLNGIAAGESEEGLRRYVELCAFDATGRLIGPELHHIAPQRSSRP